MVSGYNFSPRRRFAVLTALVAVSWGMVGAAADAIAQLAP